MSAGRSFDAWAYHSLTRKPPPPADGAPRAEPEVDLPTGSPKRGAKLFKEKCAQCHSIDSRSASVPFVPTVCAYSGCAQGPPLWGVIGRRAGTIQGFPYSKANRNSGIEWSGKHLFQYLRAPAQYIPGTNAFCFGVPKTRDTADIVAYLDSCR